MTAHRDAGRVLLVDDRKEQISILAAVLETRFAIRTAESAETGAALLDEDLVAVVSDFGLPGHDGLWLLRQASQRAPLARRILVTAQPADEFADSVRSGLVQLLLTKPIDLDELVAGVARA